MTFLQPSTQDGPGFRLTGHTEAPVPLSRLALKPCINCRQRKVKCDRGNPCTGCTRFAKVCIYEEGRSPSSESSPQQAQGQRGSSQSPSGLESSSSILNGSLKEGDSRSSDERGDSGWLLYERGLSLYIPPGHFVKLFEEVNNHKLGPQNKQSNANGGF